MKPHLHLLVPVDPIVDLLLLNPNPTLQLHHHHLEDLVYRPTDPCLIRPLLPSKIKMMRLHHPLDLVSLNHLPYPKVPAVDHLSHPLRKGLVSYNNPDNRIYLHLSIDK